MTTNKNCIRPLFITIVVVFALLLLSTNASATTWYVDDSGDNSNSGTSQTDAWLTISYAIDNASVSDGDTIMVGDGTYIENIVVNKELTIEANSSPIIDGAGGDCINITIDNVTIDGFEIRNGSNGTLIQPLVDNVTVKNNQLSYNTYGGVIVLGDGEGSGIHINCNDITDNGVYGVESERTISNVSATLNWWGDTSGPYNLLSNPFGTGDNVSDYVDYVPWSFTPDPCEPKTIGFWKNHPDSVEAVLTLSGIISLGNTSTYHFNVSDFSTAQEVFNNVKGKKNANNMLAAQLLAAELNVAHLDHLSIGYCYCIDDYIDAADEFLSAHGYEGPDTPGTVDKGDKDEANIIKDNLDDFNNGECTCP